jgi:hypothetical protein
MKTFTDLKCDEELIKAIKKYFDKKFCLLYERRFDGLRKVIKKDVKRPSYCVNCDSVNIYKDCAVLKGGSCRQRCPKHLIKK